MGPTIFSALGLKAKGKLKQLLFSEVLNATATIDPPSIAASGQATAPVTVTGAALGDYVLVAAPYDLQGVGAHGYVSAANTVTVLLKNGTAAAVDLASGTWKIKVLKG